MDFQVCFTRWQRGCHDFFSREGGNLFLESKISNPWQWIGGLYSLFISKKRVTYLLHCDFQKRWGYRWPECCQTWLCRYDFIFSPCSRFLFLDFKRFRFLTRERSLESCLARFEHDDAVLGFEKQERKTVLMFLVGSVLRSDRFLAGGCEQPLNLFPPMVVFVSNYGLSVHRSLCFLKGERKKNLRLCNTF